MNAESIGSKIMEALTKDQVYQFVEAAFSVIDSFIVSFNPKPIPAVLV
jgi:hypothetical protein